MMNKLRNRKGFNLTELLVVIVILGILVMLALPRYFGSIKDAKVATCDANARSLNGTIAAYMAKNKLSKLPTTFALSSLEKTETEEGYFDKIPECPFDAAKKYELDGNQVKQHDHSAD